MDSLKELQELIQEKYGLDPSSFDEKTLIADTGLDSLAMGELLFAIEDRFDITVPDNQAQVATLAELAQLIDRLRAAKARAAA